MAKQNNVSEETNRNNVVNVIPDIGSALVPADRWAEFKKRLIESGETVEGYFTATINNEIENALEISPEVLEPKTEPEKDAYYRKYWPGYREKMAELKKRYLEA